MVTAEARPHIFWVQSKPETRESVRGWPVGRALLETLGSVNPDVHEALSAERAALIRNGYPEDFPLPALWWAPAAD